MNSFLKFFKPLIFDTEVGELSLARFYFTLLIFGSFYFWFWLKVDIPATLFQVLMLLLTYLVGSKSVKIGKNYFETKAQSFNPITDGKRTPEMEKYKSEASKAAKCDE